MFDVGDIVVVNNEPQGISRVSTMLLPLYMHLAFLSTQSRLCA